VADHDDGPDRKTPAHSRVAGGTQRARDVLCDRRKRRPPSRTHPGDGSRRATRWRTTSTRIPSARFGCSRHGGSELDAGLDALRLAGVRPTHSVLPGSRLWLAPDCTTRLTCPWAGVRVGWNAGRAMSRRSPRGSYDDCPRGDSPAHEGPGVAGGHSGHSHPRVLERFAGLGLSMCCAPDRISWLLGIPGNAWGGPERRVAIADAHGGYRARPAPARTSSATCWRVATVKYRCPGTTAS